MSSIATSRWLLQLDTSVLSPDSQGYGYHITPDETYSLDWPDSLSDRKGDIANAISKLGSLDIKDIELYATIHFVSSLNGELPREEIVEAVKGLKPRFPKKVIEQSYDQLGAGLL